MTDKSEQARPEGQQPIINIVGEKVALGPIRRDLLICSKGGPTTSK